MCKGIILAGGSWSRLYPITKGVSKQLLPIYDKPMIYYPLSVLMLANIREILIITTPEDNTSFKRLLGDGSQLGISLQYAIQEKPDGLAQAFLIAEEFLAGDSACLILGDNIFHGPGFHEMLLNAIHGVDGDFGCKYATVFGYYVNDPERYGVASIGMNGFITGIEEKPKKPKSNYAIVGLYFYPNDVVEKAKAIKPSKRGELEITSLNNLYIKEENMVMEILPRGFAWLDTGTFESLSDASNYIETIEKRQGLKISCIEEIAFNKGWISNEQLLKLAKEMEKNDYGQYLMKIYNKSIE
jgi:glucose-1-phosphate thymidylyltransferase